MGRKVDVADLVDAAEIGRRLGVGRKALYEWRRRYPDFPAPVLTLPRATIWCWPDVERWARRTGRL